MVIPYSRKIRRIPGKIKLTLLEAPLIRSISQSRYEKRLAKFEELKPSLSADEAKILASIEQSGAIFTDIDDLPFCPGRGMLLESAHQFMADLRAEDPGKENSLRISHERIIQCPPVYLWGLDERILDIAENCLGQHVFYHRVELRRDLVNKDNPTRASQWHRDPADHKIFKLIVYLNDVAVDGGPFEFISKPVSTEAATALGYTRSGYICDADMERVVPREHWNACIGRAGSVIVGDTAGIFHRIRAPAGSDRLSITYTYTSRNPIRIYDEVRLPSQDLIAIGKYLTDRQRSCLVAH